MLVHGVGLQMEFVLCERKEENRQAGRKYERETEKNSEGEWKTRKEPER